MTCTGRENLTLAVKLAFSQHRYAEGYRVGPKKGLVFYWATPEKPWSPTPQPWPDGFTPFPFKMDADGVVDFALRWLAEADYGQEPDHDGDNSKGWSAYTEDWGHVGGDWRPSSPSSPPGRCTESRRRAMADLPDLIAQLRAAAENATPREWLADGCVVAHRGRVHRSTYELARTILPQDAAYIAAAQPQNITRLLDTYAECERERNLLRLLLVRYGDKVKMSMAARPEWQECVDAAFSYRAAHQQKDKADE